MSKYVGFDALVGEKIKSISDAQQGSDEIVFETESGRKFVMNHMQDCCENVAVEDIVGNLQDLVGETVLLAEERSQDASAEGGLESGTWTFYEIRTPKTSLTIRWLGESNGYYSEAVSFYEVTK